MYRMLTVFAFLAAVALPAGAQARPSPLDLSLEPDQARAVMAVLTARADGDTVPDSLWARLHAAEGYRRAMERERGMNELFGLDRGINDASFREWVLSEPSLDQLEAQRVALAAWEAVDLEWAGARALAYLPPGARLKATIYPIIREQQNSFVWEDGTGDPAIFMYVHPGKAAADLQHTLAHELHHIGLSGVCTEAGTPTTPELAQAKRWLSGFGEGIAVLAAAGGPDSPTHPHDPPEILDPWVARLDSLEQDMSELEGFFTEILDGRLSGDEIGRRGLTFFSRPGSPQAAFYTVGWHMAVTVERALGRDAVIASLCDPARLLLDYQKVATEAPSDSPIRSTPDSIRSTPDSIRFTPDSPIWSASFIQRIRQLAATDEGIR
ncbi:MAG: DUF5700 domain-containing putative Zn-dependent protease [Longimicrobiales bacterium]